MKLALFFALSAALHAGALFYPVSFTPRAQPRFIPVTLVTLDDTGGGSNQGSMGKFANRSKTATPVTAKGNGTRSTTRPWSGGSRDALEQAGAASVQSAGEPTQLIAAAISEDQEFPSSKDSPVSAQGGQTGARAAFASGADGGGALGGGWRVGHGGASDGPGRGSGSGGGFSQRDFRLTQARYRETPKPLYPEQARKEGQQGRVLLRVLVDQQGRSKSVEVSLSSGSQSLDRAAVEAIRLWRFAPARYDDQPVESWVRIPVDFRLTDAPDQ